MNADLSDAVPDLEVLLAAVSAGATECAMNSRVHGPRHWRDVARVGVALARETPRADQAVVFCFAMLHDTQRLNEYEDPDHGPRAAAFAVTLADRGLLAPAGKQLSALVSACECHTGSGPLEDPTLGVCLDADRLTLWRVGKVPLARYLSTTAGRDGAAPRWSRELLESPDVGWSAIFAAYGAGPPAPRKVTFKLPEEYWSWTEEQQRAWASEAATDLQQGLGIEPTT